VNEKQVCTEITKSFFQHGHYAYKIKDPNYQEIMRGAEKRPFDIVAFVNEFGLAIEVKLIKKWQKFSPIMFKEHQFYHLDKIKNQGGLAYVFLNIRIPELKENRLIIFDWHKWGEVLKKTGLSRERLAELDYCQGAKGLFNLYTFLKEFNEIGHTDIDPDSSVLQNSL
jgi:penicillin-binding protein-related factor A (putative recombinase)